MLFRGIIIEIVIIVVMTESHCKQQWTPPIVKPEIYGLYGNLKRKHLLKNHTKNNIRRAKVNYV